MFDIGASELLVIVIVAIVVIGPKQMPLAMRTAGRWIGKMRRVSGHFRAGIDAMVREAELEDLEKQWKEQNAKIMAEFPDANMTGQEPQGVGAEGRLAADAPSPDVQIRESETANANGAAQPTISPDPDQDDPPLGHGVRVDAQAKPKAEEAPRAPDLFDSDYAGAPDAGVDTPSASSSAASNTKRAG